MSVSELKQACETVVNASPSDYEAACEVWTQVCTPQAVLAALQEAEADLKDLWGHYQDLGRLLHEERQRGTDRQYETIVDGLNYDKETP